MVNMAETVEVTFTAPENMIKAVKHICESFDMTLDEYMTGAIRGEIGCGYNDLWCSETEPFRSRVARKVEEILGEKP